MQARRKFAKGTPVQKIQKKSTLSAAKVAKLKCAIDAAIAELQAIRAAVVARTVAKATKRSRVNADLAHVQAAYRSILSGDRLRG